jgi:hypothetical protein
MQVPIHPLLTAVLVADTLVALVLIGAAVTAFQVALDWTPADPRPRQLKLQARQEAWSLATTCAAGIYLAAGLLLIGVLTNILPGLVPGAMCGTGVLQACTPHGQRMLAWRLLATAGLFCWQRLETLNRSDPLAVLTPTNARVLLVLLPIVLLGCGETLRTLTGFDTRLPVDCCTALYDRITSPQSAASAQGLLRPAAPWLFALTTALLCVLPRGLDTLSPRRAARRGGLLLGVAVIWLVAGGVTLVRVLAPYHYEVLHHYCPWCLFLPEHRGIGFPLLIFWGLVALESLALWALAQTRRSPAGRLTAVTGMLRGARRRLWIGAFGFAALAAGPALWWRWQYGLWIGG